VKLKNENNITYTIDNDNSDEAKTKSTNIKISHTRPAQPIFSSLQIEGKNSN